MKKERKEGKKEQRKERKEGKSKKERKTGRKKERQEGSKEEWKKEIKKERKEERKEDNSLTIFGSGYFDPFWATCCSKRLAARSACARQVESCQFYTGPRQSSTPTNGVPPRTVFPLVESQQCKYPVFCRSTKRMIIRAAATKKSQVGLGN